MKVLDCMLSLRMIENVSEQDVNGNTALHMCCQRNSSKVNLEIIDLLLINNIKTNLRNHNGYSPIEMLRSDDLRAIKLKQSHSLFGTQSDDRSPVKKQTTNNDEKPSNDLKPSYARTVRASVAKVIYL